MPTFKQCIKIIICILSVITLTACYQSNKNQPLIVGTIAGPETTLMNAVKQIAKNDYGLTIHILSFTDYAMPNRALVEKSIDVNVFQHNPYLQNAIHKWGYPLIAVGKTFIYPMGIYSKKVKQLTDLPKSATIAIPNDPSNETRALLLCQKAGLITLKAKTQDQLTPTDVLDNPKNLQFKTVAASQLPRVLPDVDAAAINTNYAILAALIPSQDAIFLETPDSPYANLVVIRKENEKDPRIKQLLMALHSAAVIQKANELFKGQAIPAWQ